MPDLFRGRCRFDFPTVFAVRREGIWPRMNLNFPDHDRKFRFETRPADHPALGSLASDENIEAYLLIAVCGNTIRTDRLQMIRFGRYCGRCHARSDEGS